MLRASWDDLPIFPLPGVVLLPGELLPLHVFEPRYRALVATLVAGSRPLLGMATIEPGHDPAGDPPLWPVLGVGRLVGHAPLPDGRSHILVQHVEVAEIVAERYTDEPFRRVAARRLEAPPASSYGSTDALRILAAQVLARTAGLGARGLLDLDGEALVHALAVVFLRDPELRRDYLVARDGRIRRELVEAVLGEHLVGVGDSELET